MKQLTVRLTAEQYQRLLEFYALYLKTSGTNLSLNEYIKVTLGVNK